MLTAEGKDFNGSATEEMRVWFREKYRTRQEKLKKDPIPSWTKRVDTIRREVNPHLALKKYRDFMDETSAVREHIGDAAMHTEDAYQQAFDEGRGKF